MTDDIPTDIQNGCSDIADAIADALVSLEEARGIAAAVWGDKDPRTIRVESAWAEAYTVFHEYFDELNRKVKVPLS